MQKRVRYTLAALGLLILAQFGSQDGNVSGGGKPKVNFYGKITDSSDKTFNAENIVFEGLYKQIPVYQVPPQKTPASYEPADNVTRLDLSEIQKITVDVEQSLQTIKNRKYIVIKVYSKIPSKERQFEPGYESHNSAVNEYLVEADKKINCDESNPAGPIEKEIKIKAIKEVVIEGYKSPKQDQEVDTEKDCKKKKTANAEHPSRRKQFIAYVQEWLMPKRIA